MKEQRLFAVASQCPRCSWGEVIVCVEGKINPTNLACDNCSTRARLECMVIRAITPVEVVAARMKGR